MFDIAALGAMEPVARRSVAESLFADGRQIMARDAGAAMRVHLARNKAQDGRIRAEHFEGVPDRD